MCADATDRRGTPPVFQGSRSDVTATLQEGRPWDDSTLLRVRRLHAFAFQQDISRWNAPTHGGSPSAVIIVHGHGVRMRIRA